jgi:hypothetical protein
MPLGDHMAALSLDQAARLTELSKTWSVPRFALRLICRRLFDHLVGEGEQPIRHAQAERLRGRCVDDQFVFSRLQYRQVGWLLALEDAAGVNANLAKCIRKAGAIAHEAAGRGELAPRVNCRKPMLVS